MTKTNKTVEFFKMQGCGNDFVFIDNRALKLPVAEMADWARKICPRAVSVGADGLVFLETDPSRSDADYIWHFYNADGSRAEMCGNASRCAAKLALELGLAGPEHILGTDVGPIRAKVLSNGEVKVQLTPPKDMELNIRLPMADGPDLDVHFVDTGVPHTVHFTDNTDAIDIKAMGPAVRYHERFAPKGANSNFAQVVDSSTMLLRTYERGVEGETLACGTGVAAAVILANALGLTGPEVHVTTTGQEVLTISLDNGMVFLTGKALKVYTGALNCATVID